MCIRDRSTRGHAHVCIPPCVCRPVRLAPHPPRARGNEGRQGHGYRLSRSSGAVVRSETRPTSRLAAFPRSATTIPIVPSDHGVAGPVPVAGPGPARRGRRSEPRGDPAQRKGCFPRSRSPTRSRGPERPVRPLLAAATGRLLESAGRGPERSHRGLVQRFAKPPRLGSSSRLAPHVVATSLAVSAANSPSDPRVDPNRPAGSAFSNASPSVCWPLILRRTWAYVCLLYTSDAADDLTRVDLGGRRI